MMDWYSLRVISGKEKKIRDSLLFELERDGYSAKVDQIFVPSENIVEMRDGKKRVRINAIAFLTAKDEPIYEQQNMNYLMLMRELTEQSGGAMVVIN